MTCKICNSPTKQLFEKIILNKYKTFYHKCTSCDFIQTDEPVWIEEAYSNVITSTDIGLLNRNIYLVKETKIIIDACFPEAKVMLDYAGGYGVYVRLMRDEGYNFYRQDAYCENIFAKTFDIETIKDTRFDIVTAFEVLEHFVNPLQEIEKVLSYAETAIFSTVLIPENDNDLPNWWYLATETGQHVAFYSEKSMNYIAKKYHKNYYCRNGNLHVFTSAKLNADQLKEGFTIKKASFLERLSNKLLKVNTGSKRVSLLESDYNSIRKSLSKQ
ncbi:MAG: class I SAM-dependent methyltransferase [Bacteroidetes bacterium]|nr:class I SAM-dependent methyltransferase [Bacteroidota bacterium]